jgi:hypothetical protein
VRALKHILFSDKFGHQGKPQTCKGCPFSINRDLASGSFYCFLVRESRFTEVLPPCDAGQWREAAGEEFEGMVRRLDAADKLSDALLGIYRPDGLNHIRSLYESLRAEALEAPRSGPPAAGPRAPARGPDASRKAVEASPPSSAAGGAGRRLWALSYEKSKDESETVHRFLYDDATKEAVDELFNEIWSDAIWSWWPVEVR